MDTSQGGSSQDIHSLNEISFSFIVLGYRYFSVIKWKQFISRFCGYCMEITNISFLNPGFYTCFGQATIRKWIEGGMILKIGDEHTIELDTYHSYGLRKLLWVLEARLGMKTWNLFTHTRVWHTLLRAIYYHYWVFIR